MPKGQKTYDWYAFKAEWLTTDLTINQFREKKGIEKGLFYRNIDADEWWESRSLISKKAATRIINERANILVRKYDDYYKLWDGVKMQADSILKQTRQSDGTIKPLETTELKNLSEAIERAMKSERLLDGESTEKIETGIDVYNFVLGLSKNEDRIREAKPVEQQMAIEQPLQNQVQEQGNHDIPIQ